MSKYFLYKAMIICSNHQQIPRNQTFKRLGIRNVKVAKLLLEVSLTLFEYVKQPTCESFFLNRESAVWFLYSFFCGNLKKEYRFSNSIDDSCTLL